jgi:hypothetical protein
LKFTRKWLEDNVCNSNLIKDEIYISSDDDNKEILYRIIFKYKCKFYEIYLWKFNDNYLSTFYEYDYNCRGIKEDKYYYDIECPEVEYKEVKIKKWVEISEYEG